MLLAQISDFHVTRPGELAYGRSDTNAGLAAAVAAINTLDTPPDLVLGTGDLVQSGRDEEYANLRVLLAPLKAPFLPLPGNHDLRAGLRRAFPDLAFGPDHLQLERDLGPLRVLTVDTLREGSDEPQLDDGRLGWLAERLARPGPTLLAMHHPPCPAGVAWLEPKDPRWSEPLQDLVTGSPHVVGVVCGHVHRTMVRHWAGAPLATAPSTGHQVALDLAPDAPPTLALEAPGFLLHRWTGAELITWAASTRGFLNRFNPGSAA